MAAPAPHGDAAEKKSHRGAASLRRKIIADDGNRRRRQHCFTQPHTYARGEDLVKTMRQATAERAQAPDDDTGDNKAAPGYAIGQIAQGDTCNAIDQRECRSHQQADLRIADAELGPHRIDEQA